MRPVLGNTVQLPHDTGGIFQVCDRFIKRDNVDRKFVRLPTSEQKQTVDLKGVQRVLAGADDVPFTSLRAVLQLDRFDRGDRAESVAGQLVVERVDDGGAVDI